jgi:glycosyltransferase involved in cell wall biosynthesis
MSLPITATIITLNEERNIEGVVRSAQRVCDEVVVVDSESRDRTCEIARDLGARVYVQPYLGDGLQKDFGVQFAKNRWILSIDADERLEDSAVACIRGLGLETTPHDAFAFRRKTFVGDKWMRIWYPDYATRLYDRTRCRYLPVPGHSRVDAKNPKKLKCDLLHYSYADWSDMVRRIDKFSSRGARALHEQGRRAHAWDPVGHGLVSFVKHYFVRKGFRDGLDGLTIAIISAVGTYMKYAMLIERQRKADGVRAGRQRHGSR